METPKTSETIAHFLKELERPARSLTAWELDFLESITDQFTHKGTLSDKQFSVLERIYTEKTA